jgi:hypothetical protein
MTYKISNTNFQTTSHDVYSFAALEKEIDQDVNNWEEEAKKLSSEEGSTLRRLITREAGQIKKKIREMRALGHGCDEILVAIHQAREEMKSFFTQFRDGCSSYKLKKPVVSDKLQETTRKIQALKIRCGSYLPEYTPENSKNEPIQPDLPGGFHDFMGLPNSPLRDDDED